MKTKPSHAHKLGIGQGDTHIKEIKTRQKPDTIYDFNAWVSYVEKWQISGPLPISIKVLWKSTGSRMGIFVEARLRTVDPIVYKFHKCQYPVEVEIIKYVPSARPNRSTDRWLRAVCRELYLHELDEWIFIDGKRRFNPHSAGAGKRL